MNFETQIMEIECKMRYNKDMLNELKSNGHVPELMIQYEEENAALEDVLERLKGVTNAL